MELFLLAQALLIALSVMIQRDRRVKPERFSKRGPVSSLDLVCCNVKPINFSTPPSYCNNVLLVRPQPQNSDTNPLPDEICVIDWYSYNPLPMSILTATEYINVFRMAPFTVGVVVSLGTFIFYIFPYLVTHRCRNPQINYARHSVTWVEYCFIPSVLLLEMAAAALVLISAYAERVIARQLDETICRNSPMCQSEINAILDNNTCHVRVLTILSILEPIITFPWPFFGSFYKYENVRVLRMTEIITF